MIDIIFGMLCAFAAGYILHGWEFDRHLEAIENRLEEAEARARQAMEERG